MRKLNALIIGVALLTTLAAAQTAKVAALSPEDAAKAKQLYGEYKAAEKAWDDFHEAVHKKTCTIKGFEWGYEFSDDFRYIVPKGIPSTGITTIIGGGGTMCSSCVTTAPFSGPLTLGGSSPQVAW